MAKMIKESSTCVVCTLSAETAENSQRGHDKQSEKLLESPSKKSSTINNELLLLSALWKCLTDNDPQNSSNSVSIHGDNYNSENSIHFCQNCEKFLVEFEQITREIRRLHRRLTTVKFTIIAKFISASEISQDHDHLNVATDIRNVVNKSKLEAIRKQLQKEYLPNVILEKASLPFPTAVPEALSTIYADGNLEGMTGHESDEDYCRSEMSLGPEQPSNDGRNEHNNSSRAGPKSRALKISNDLFRKKKVVCIQTGPNEYSYGEKYKFTCQDNTFQCSQCTVNVKGRTSMLKHITRMHMPRSAVQKKRNPEKSRGLFKWEEISPSEILYAEKFKITFNGEKYYCEECGSICHSMDSIFRHVRATHIGDKNGILTPKKNRLMKIENRPNEYLYREKYEVSFNPDKGIYQCKFCGLEQESPGRVMDHIESIHVLGGKNTKFRLKSLSTVTVAPNEFLYNGKYPFKFDPAEQVYACGVCEYQNDNIRCIYPHIRANHYTDEDRKEFSAVQVGENEFLYGGKYRIFFQAGKYFCGLCNYHRFELSDLYGHIRRHHLHEEPGNLATPQTAQLQDDKPILDPTATASCLTYQGISYSFDSSTRRYTCSICPVHVRHRSTMLMHLRQRHVDKPGQHVCEICGDSFQGQRLLNRHRSHHGGPKYKCTHCGKGFRVKDNFKVHLAIHELGEEAKQFQCEYCGKKFVRKRFLEVHVRIHTGEKPVKCDLCSETFADSGKRSYHRKTVHGILPKKNYLD